MATYEAEIGSSWPADQTFSYLADFSNAERWDPGTLSSERLDAGRVGTGSSFRLVVPFLGSRLTLTYRISQYSAQAREVTLEAVSALLLARDQIAVQSVGDDSGSKVTYRAQITPRGALRFLDPVLARGFRAVGDRAAAGLARSLAEPVPVP